METLSHLILPVLVLGGVAFLMYLAGRHRKVIKERWAEVADGLGLRFIDEGAFGEIKGTLDGCQVTVDTSTQKMKRQNKHTRVVTAMPRSLGMGLKLSPRNSLQSLGELVGVRDIETGDRLFDEAFTVKGEQPEQIVRLLNHTVRDAILKYRDEVEDFELGDNELSTETGGILTYELEQLIRAQVKLTNTITRRHAEVLVSSANDEV